MYTPPPSIALTMRVCLLKVEEYMCKRGRSLEEVCTFQGDDGGCEWRVGVSDVWVYRKRVNTNCSWLLRCLTIQKQVWTHHSCVKTDQIVFPHLTIGISSKSNRGKNLTRIIWHIKFMCLVHIHWRYFELRYTILYTIQSKIYPLCFAKVLDLVNII